MEPSRPSPQPAELPPPPAGLPRQHSDPQSSQHHDETSDHEPRREPQSPPQLPHIPLPPRTLPIRTAQSTPITSPGLFSPTTSRHNALLPQTSVSEASTPAPHGGAGHPYLHPLQSHKVRETHKALIDSDNITGRKLINQYEVIEEIGRGMHGKVKLARNLETGDNVAIKIIPRFSKKRRLGKVTAMDPQDKTKKEIAILKKIRHPNVVALLEVIDDPELKKIYMVLEHVELGEIVWRKKGLPHICQYERRRVEREMRGEPPSADEEKYEQLLERRQALKELKRAKMARNYPGATDYWSVEHGAADEGSSGRQSRIPSKDDFAAESMPASLPASRQSSRAPSRSQSIISSGEAPSELDEDIDWEDDMETPGPLRSNPNSTSALEGTMYGAYADDAGHSFRGRASSMADSIISHMSSVDYNYQGHDAFTDDYSYVPCFTLDQARSTFRDTVLGLEYLHYQGVVHRDIKPANLLWTKEHRVKISDFGVSYFGRPIRDGEPDDVSEAEARDFVDDDLELAKTVGTPAFFAPELCYTDVDKEQPRVSEQIDVWSLGVALYCLIYARIPFLAEDEFQMFRKIATEDVYIPRRRLKPVDPSTSPSTTSLYKRQNTHPYRDDNDLEYEDVDNLLYDLLRQMLSKNPEKRIRLRDIKRHPWVVHGIANPIGWLDDTDPARPSSGRRIQVDERDLSAAVVPLTFLERARSVARKVVGKVMHPLAERSDSKTRRRATSSAASSAGDSMLNNVPTTPQQRNGRRRSLLPDDYFANAAADGATDDHANATLANVPLESVEYDPMATVIPPPDVRRTTSNAEMHAQPVLAGPNSHSHRYTQSYGRVPQLWSSSLPSSHTAPSIPASHRVPRGDHPADRMASITKGAGSAVDNSDLARSRSVDRGLFASTDKRAQAQVSVNTAVAPGNIQGSHICTSPLASRRGAGIASPLLATSQRSSSAVASYQNTQPHSDPDFQQLVRVEMSERPRTAHRVETVPDAISPVPRNYNTSTPDSFARAKAAQFRKQAQELEQAKSSSPVLPTKADPVNVPCPPSPDDEEFSHEGPSRGETMMTAQSSSTESMDGVGTPLTSPSEITSPVSTNPTKAATQSMPIFPSDPSLPALLSSASSVSADLEGELLGQPGVVSKHPSLLETTESLTPPAMAKEPAGGFPLDQVFENAPAMQSGTLAIPVHDDGDQSPATDSTISDLRQEDDEGYNEDDGSDEGSDDGILLMAKSKKKMTTTSTASRAAPFPAKRRNTNASTISTDTAKNVAVNDSTPDHTAQP